MKLPGANILDQIRCSPVDEAGTGLRGHLALLYMLSFHQCAKGSIVELGTGRGRAAWALYAGLHLPWADMHSFDVNPECGVYCPKSDQFHFVLEDSVKAADRFVNQSVSLLFIDSRHYFHHTLKELVAWAPKMLEGSGVICGHDTNNPCDPGYDVLGAVRMFMEMESQSGRWELQEFKHDYGFFILWPIVKSGDAR